MERGMTRPATHESALKSFWRTIKTAIAWKLLYTGLYMLPPGQFVRLWNHGMAAASALAIDEFLQDEPRDARTGPPARRSG